MYILRIRTTYTYTYMFEIGFSENTPAECLLQRPIPRGGLAVGKPSIERASPKRKKRSVRNERCVFAVVEAVRNLILICCTYIFYVYFSETYSKNL